RAASSPPSTYRGPKARGDHEQRASRTERHSERLGEPRMVQRLRQAPPVHRSDVLRRGSSQRRAVQARPGSRIASRRRGRRRHRVAYRFSGAATWSLMLIALYAMFEARRRATEELHTVRVAALAAERAVLEGDLRAMQARVDPDLLFDTLLSVDRAYARSTRS